MKSSCDVLIVGGGPTGLMMANLLAREKVSFRIIDKLADRAHESRALVIHAKSMELFNNLNLGDIFLKTARPSIGLSLFVNGGEKVHLDFGDIGAKDTPFSSVYFLSQAETERLLIENLKKSGIQVERPTELISFSQEPDCVQAKIKNMTTGTIEDIQVKYLVGCDGSHSSVRHALNLAFDGAAYQRDFLLADVRVDWSLPKDRLGIFLTDTKLLAHFPLTEEISRFIISSSDLPADAQGDPTLQEIEDLAKQITKVPVKLSNPNWLARFHLHHRGVKEYRVGRVFLAGDAAHIHSPAGGQGMNTGLQDAANLAWKLILVLQKKSPENLLNTYQSERHRIAEVLLKTTDRIFNFTTLNNLWLAKARNWILPKLVHFVLIRPSFRKRAFRYVSQLGVRYHASEFVAEDISAEDDLFRKAPPAGSRAPDAKVSGGHLFDWLKGPGFHLLAFNDRKAGENNLDPLDKLKQKYRGLIHFHEFKKTSDNTELFERYGIADSGIYIIRPDGYIAFRSCGDLTYAAEDFLGRLFLH